VKKLKRVYHYSKVKWKGRPRSGKPFCPECNAKPENVIEIKRYTGDPPTEMFVDYRCTACRREFTVNWS